MGSSGRGISDFIKKLVKWFHTIPAEGPMANGCMLESAGEVVAYFCMQRDNSAIGRIHICCVCIKIFYEVAPSQNNRNHSSLQYMSYTADLFVVSFLV